MTSSDTSENPISPSTSTTLGICRARLFQDLGPRRFRCVGREDQPDHDATATAAERSLELAHQILGLFLQIQIAVAQQPERTHRLDLVTREDHRHEKLQQIFQWQEPDHTCLRIRQTHEPAQLMRDGQQRLQRVTIRLPFQFQHQRKFTVRDKREGMRGVDRNGRQDRKDLVHEGLFKVLHLSFLDIFRTKDLNPGGFQLCNKALPDLHLAVLQFVRHLLDPLKLILRGQPIDGGRRDIMAHQSPQRRHPHRVEFIQV